MTYSIGMMPGPELGDKPSGNRSSLVPEISGRGVNGASVKAQKFGGSPDIKHHTSVRNNSSQKLNGTGRS